MTDEEDIYFLEDQTITLDDFPCDKGWILDFGGGGEGVIGQIKESQVIAIDRRESELLEAIENGSKALPIIMDGKELKFLDNTFHTATSFYTLMYVPEENLLSILKEFYRVLTLKGKFIIWGVNFTHPTEFDKNLIAFRLKIKLPSGKLIETGYGTRKKSQSMKQIINFAKEAGFTIITSKEEGILFQITLQK
ncbi:class I SAM-dependent methyltransferase [Promethearchaeum syntrophicum]|uniref:Class I SAM-dependent methyltransferase n=1 Tax=Promethearchaeum syntrophicum TaxID=2594042 RepID=A0A5B9DDB9_9ARCH|nr:class I SAM-dependent methyltransferase [Candidatus Prometheoarchaeum syntrophicum]QEE16770.1 hypothetical protein DSAG12_02600 [Candidatus Prometheoarchaeum syntrophicum]